MDDTTYELTLTEAEAWALVFLLHRAITNLSTRGVTAINGEVILQSLLSILRDR